MGFGGGGTISTSEKRIDTLRLQQSAYGIAVPIVFGTTRISGNLLDYNDFTAVAHTTTTTSGGKGGGGVTQQNTTYTYTAAIILGLCEGTIQKIGKLWIDKEISSLQATNLTLYQNEVWPYMQGRHPDKALAYKNTAYVAGTVDLGSTGEVPNLSLEVYGFNQYNQDIIDANPSVVIKELLINPRFGVDFPVDNIGDLNLYSNYCVANGLFISPALTEESECQEIITNILKCTNSEAVWSQGKLKIIPYGAETVSGNGETYTPLPSPLYDLTDADFMPDEGEMPVVCKRGRAADAYNIQPYEFLNRANDYNVESDSVKDAANIGIYGPRPAEIIEMRLFCRKQAAQNASQSILQRNLYVRNQYEFNLGLKYYLLESMDIVTLTEANLGLDKEPVRIISIEELDGMKRHIVAEECPDGVFGITQYPAQEADRPILDFNSSAGDVEPPVIFEPPPEIVTGSSLELCLAVCGRNPLWGGALVWASYDGDTYKKIAEVTAPARLGKLTDYLPAGLANDYQNNLKVAMLGSNTKLNSAAAIDADFNNTLCYVDGEYISYETAILDGTGEYTLKGLRRGVYGSDITLHPPGGDFVRIDSAVVHYSYRVEDIGQTIYLKFTSYNIFMAGLQDLAEVKEHKYVINGSPPIDSPEFTIIQSGQKLIVNIKNIFQDEDRRSFFTYELRMGSSWESADTIGHFTDETYIFDAQYEGTLTFWLKTINSYGVYCKTPARALINVIGLPKTNVILTRTWTTDEAIEYAGFIPSLDGIGLYHQARTTVGDYDEFFSMFGRPAKLKRAWIEFPVIDIGEDIIDPYSFYRTPLGSYKIKTLETVGDYEPFSTIFDADSFNYLNPQYAVETILSASADFNKQPNVRVRFEYATSMDGVNWSDWASCRKSQFFGRYVKMRVIPHPSDGITPITIKGASASIDVPDIELYLHSISIPAAKTTIPYGRRFLDIPVVSVFAQDVNGMQVSCRITNYTLVSFDIELLNAAQELIPGYVTLATIRGY